MLKTEIHCKLPFQYLYVNRNSSLLYILLHGYQQNAEWMLKKFENRISNASLLIPQGPFPVPFQKGNSIHRVFSWYFFDIEKQAYYIDMQSSISAILNLPEIKKHSQVRILGFSQGGFLAPFVAQEISQCKEVLLLNAVLRYDDLAESAHFKIYQYHGVKDEIIPMKRAQLAHQKYLDRGNAGKFYQILGDTHKIDDEFLDKVEL